MKQGKNIVYAGIETGQKYCLCRGFNIVKRLPEQGNKYSILHLRISLEAIFSKMNQSNKNVFIFRQGNWINEMNVLYPCLLKSFVLSICSRNPMKTHPWAIFARKHTTRCILGSKHDGCLKDDYCVSLFKLKFLITTLCHMFYLWRKWLRKLRLREHSGFRGFF